MEMKSWYEVLEVSESATPEQIRSAYLKLAREYHPDRVPEHLTKLRADAEDKFKQIQQAWTVLSEPAKRKRYDFVRRKGEESAPSRTPNAAPRPTSTPSAAAAAHPENLRDFLRRKQDAVKWSLIVLISTLVLVVIGEVVVSHQSNPNSTSSSDETLQPLAVPIPADIRKFSFPPRHIQTWRGAANSGLEVQLLGVAARSNELELTFRIKAGDHSDLLLYEPVGATGRTKRILGKDVVVDREFGELYLEDSSGARYVSTSGFNGGQQTGFNLYNFTRRIDFKPHQELVLSAKFPPLARETLSITFVSPALGKWQPEWRWPDITLK